MLTERITLTYVVFGERIVKAGDSFDSLRSSAPIANNPFISYGDHIAFFKVASHLNRWETDLQRALQCSSQANEPFLC